MMRFQGGKLTIKTGERCRQPQLYVRMMFIMVTVVVW